MDIFAGCGGSGAGGGPFTPEYGNGKSVTCGPWLLSVLDAVYVLAAFCSVAQGTKGVTKCIFYLPFQKM